jgi:ThiF family protein
MGRALTRLTEAQQERYARHLLLDGLGGEGQERLLSSCVRVRGTGRAARWAARYLAASGVGTLVLDDPGAAAECGALAPELRIALAGDSVPDLDLDLREPPAPGQPPAEHGAAAALAALRRLVRP